MSKWIAGLAMIVVATVAAGLWAFEPWTKFTSSTVDEDLPTVASEASVPGDASTEGAVPESVETPPTKAPTTTTPEPKPELVELARGQFVDAEHPTSGAAKVIKLADGSRFVRLEGFSTSNGPDLYVGLSSSPSGGAWGSYDDIRYVQLASLKATNGNQNYEIPPDVDLGGFQSVVIWCDRFNVAFGTAPVSL